MNPSLLAMLRSVRARSIAHAVACGLPVIAVAAAVAWRSLGSGAAVLAVIDGAISLLAFSIWRARRFDDPWLARTLNGRRKDLEDSADLLFAGTDTLNPLQRLQRERLQQRLAAQPGPDLRAPWAWGRIAAIWIASALIATTIVFWPSRQAAPIVLAPSEEVAPAVPGVPRLVGQRLRIAPPTYTRLPARDEDSLDARAPQGSMLRWTLRFEPQPSAAELVFHDGKRVELTRDGDIWTTQRRLEKSALYRVVPRGAAANALRLHRLDAVADRPPQIKILAPDRSLSLVTPGQRTWPLSFEASDDYGIAANASLRITLAQGSGENITFRERTLAVAGRGSATVKRFGLPLDLAAQGMAVGDDLIVQLTIDDNRSPQPQSVRSSSLILRWPSDLGNEGTGLEGMVKKVMPAYFRSQRQIIIDAEALLKERRKLDADRFLQRSDEIGVDQRLLRLRYGQFLGEEAEGAPKPPPTNDAEEERHSEGEHDEDGHGQDSPAKAPIDDHGHDDAATDTGTAFGREADVLEEYGHTHDIAEAATLLDPETRATLKQALDQMWQSELNLRQGHPDKALPYAYKALDFIKQVQQASRIYLARVGPELPPIDETRRLSGDRAGLARRELASAAATDPDALPAELWRALAETPGQTATATADQGVPDLDALERWLRQNESQVPDPLVFVAAIDALRHDPQCASCRQQLRALLWTVLPRPPARVPRREEGDASGRRYLEALRQEDMR